MTSHSSEELRKRLRDAFRLGRRIPDIIRGEPALATKPSHDIMFAFIDAFRVDLGDVSCIGGWWPPASEVTDENLDRWIRRAIEQRRPEWDTLG